MVKNKRWTYLIYIIFLIAFAIQYSFALDINSCQELNETNTFYNLTADVNSSATCFNITADNVTLDCQGYEVNYSHSGSVGYGVYAANRNNITVENCDIKEGISTGNAKYAIYLPTTTRSLILNNTISTTGLSGHGIYLPTNSNYNRLINNTITTTGGGQGVGAYGIYVSASGYNNITGNTVNTTGHMSWGILLSLSTVGGHNLSGNNISTQKTIGIMMSTSLSPGFNNTIDASNLVEGKPVNYSYYASNQVYDGEDFTVYGQVIFAWSTNITISNSNFSSDSLTIFNSSDFNISSNNFETDKGIGLTIRAGSNNVISHNNITTLCDYCSGLWNYQSSNNNITNNKILTYNSTSNPVWVYITSSNLLISQNNLTSLGPVSTAINTNSFNESRILSNDIYTLGGTAYGFYTSTAGAGFVIENNTIITNGSSSHGYYLPTASLTHSLIKNNTLIINNAQAIRLDGSTNNVTYQSNTIITNLINDYSLYLRSGAHNFTMIDTVLNSSYPATPDFYIYNATNGGTWNFTNVTRADGSKINITWSGGANGTLLMNWYLDVNVTNSTGDAIEDANVTVYDNNTNLLFSELTQADGFIARQTVQEYLQNESGTYYSTPLNISVAMTDYHSNITVFNLTDNAQLDVLLASTTLYCSNCSDCNGKIMNSFPGDTVYLAQDIMNASGTCLEFGGKDNFTFDCQGHTIDGDNTGTDYGIRANNTNNGSDNVVLKNCHIKEFYNGGIIQNSDNFTAQNVTVANLSGDIWGFGLRFEYSNNISLSNITMHEAGEALFVYYTTNITLIDGNLTNNAYGLRFNGNIASHCNHSFTNVIAGSGYPVAYYHNEENLLIENNASVGQIALCDVNNVTLNNITMESQDGISITISTNITLANSTITGSQLYGLRVNSANVLVENCEFSDNYRAMIFGTSSNNIIRNTNVINQAGNGILIDSYSSNNLFQNVTIINALYGFYLNYPFNNNTIVNSTIKNNVNAGIIFNGNTSTNITIYNNLFNNTVNILNSPNASFNLNTSKSPGESIIGTDYLGGNYWATPTGTGYSENCNNSDADGMCDEAYAIDLYNTDYHPLTLITDTSSPVIDFTSPTPDNGTSHSANYAYINVSTSDTYNHSAFIDWNRSLVGWWNFENVLANGTVYDNSTYGNNGLMTGFAANTTVEGKRGKALEFDGMNDYVDIPASPSLMNFSQGFTLIYWEKTALTDKVAVSKVTGNGANGTGFILYPPNVWYFSINGTWATLAGGRLEGDNWHQIGLVWNTTHVQSYRDGIIIDTTNAQSMNVSDISMSIGRDNRNQNYFNGSIDEVMIFSRALSPEEINASYDAGNYGLKRNFTGLSDGNYTYKAYAIDSAGNVNSTELRTLTVDTIKPAISFISPTPDNGTSQNTDYAYINVSTSDANEHSAFIDWNRSLVGYWNFENVLSNGTVYDNSSYGNNGLMVGFAANRSVAGKRGNGAGFNKTNYINIGDSDNTDNLRRITVSLWAKANTDNLTNDESLVSNQRTFDGFNGWALYEDANNKFVFRIRNLSSSSALAISDNFYNDTDWHHIVGVYDGYEVKLYVDGISADSTANSYNLTIPDNSYSVCIGQTNGGSGICDAGSTYGYNGSIDEVIIFNRALSPEEINASYNAGTYRLYNNFTSLNDGNYTYKAYAIDEAGNVNSTETRTLTVDTIIPSLDLIGPSNNTLNITSDIIIFSYNVSDESGLANCSLIINDMINITNSTLTNDKSIIHNFTLNLSNGQYNWSINCADIAGNINNSETRNLTVNLNPDPYTYINACQELNVSGSYYKLTADVNSSATCFNITADNVTLDCDGYIINYSTSGTLGYGVTSANKWNITITGCNIYEGSSSTENKHIISLVNVNDSLIFNNTITGRASSYGINLYSASGINISNNHIEASGWNGMGVYVYNSNNNQLFNNTLNSSAAHSVYIYNSVNLTLESNSMYSPGLNSLLIRGTSANHHNHSISSSNMAEGKPVNYTFNAHDIVYDSIDFTQFGQVIFDWSSNITVKNSNFSDDSLNLFSTNASTFENNYINTTNGFGIYARDASTHNQFINNSVYVQGTNLKAVFMYLVIDTGYNNFTSNTLVATSSYALELNNGRYNNFVGNTITRLSNGAALSANSFSNTNFISNNITGGINLVYIANNLAFDSNNIISNGFRAIELNVDDPANLTFANMTVTTNATAVYALYLNAGRNNFTMINSILNASQAYDIYISNGSSKGHYNLTNVTYSDIYFGEQNNGTLYRNWYLDVNVTNSTSDALEDANVTIYDNVQSQLFNGLTSADGFTRQTVQEYYQNNSGIYYSTPLNITAEKTYHRSSYNDTVNLTNNLQVNLILEPKVAGVDDCGMLDTANHVYNLTSDVASTGTCFNITADNVTLDCQGYMINYSTLGILGYGVYAKDRNNVTVKNCNIYEGNVTTNSKYGVYFINSSNGKVNYNNISTIGGGSRAIFMYSNSNNNFIVSNNITTYGSAGSAITLQGLVNNHVENNTITTNGLNAYGLGLDSANNNYYTNNQITMGTNNSYGIYLSWSSQNNIFSNIIITTFGNGSFGVYFKAASNNNTFDALRIMTNGSNANSLYLVDNTINFKISNSVLNESYPGVQELLISNAVSGGVWNFTNVTRSDGLPVNVSWQSGANGTLNMFWYLDVNVTNSTGDALEDANVTIYDNAQSQLFNGLTSAGGFIARQTVQEYMQNKSGIYYSTPLNITAIKSGFYTYTNNSFNLTINMQIDILLESDTTNPSINFISPTPANGTVQSENYAYINVSTSDTNEHSAFIDWNRSLVGWWNFENVLANGTVYDNSSYGNNGLMVGFAANTTVDGKRGRALEFDGANCRIEVSLFPTQVNGTYSLWYKTRTLSGAHQLLSHQNHPLISQVYQNDMNLVIWYINSTGVARYFTLNNYFTTTDDWNLLTLSVKGFNFSVYKNGLYFDSYNVSDGVYTDSGLSSLSIGSYFSGLEYWNGSIDEVLIFNRTLTSQEINALYNAGSYRLFNNFTNLSDGDYSYKAYAIDAAGNINSTETRILTIDTTNPSINFISPTSDNGTVVNKAFAYINLSTTDANEHSAFIDWNRSLLLWMNFDSRNSTHVFDNSTFGNAGQISGDSNYTSNGKRGGAFQFDGSGDYITMSNNTSYNITDVVTLEAWVYPKAYTSWGGIVGRGDNYYLGISSNNFAITFKNGAWQNLYSGVFGNLNNWYHVVGIIDSINDSARIYVNGVLMNNATETTDLPSGVTVPLTIGQNSNQYFNGTIDEVRVWRRALTPQEINASYNAGTYRLERNFTNLTDGSYDYKAYTIDAAGNVNSTETRTLTVDTIIPSLDLIGPSNNTLNTTSDIIVFNYNVSDDNGLANCSLIINDVINITNSTLTNDKSIIQNFTLNLSDGQYNWSINCADTAGNINNSETRNLTVNLNSDINLPYLTVQSPTNGTYFSSNNISLNYTAYDENIDTCYYSNSTGQYIILTGCANTTFIGVEGYQNITVYVNDTSGNVNSSQIFFTIDTTIPSIDFISPTPDNGTNQNENYAYINVSTSDANEHSAFIDWNRSLVGYWNFENVLSNGTVYDNSSYGNNGLMVGFAANTTVDGKRGRALEFRNGNYVNITDSSSLSITNQVTIIVWFYPNNMNTTNNDHIAIVSKQQATPLLSNYWLGYYNGKFYTDFNNGSGWHNPYSPTNYPANQWYQVVGIIDSTNNLIQTYVNGVLVVNVSETDDLIDENGTLWIGASQSYDAANGSIDEVMIFNRALSPQEINASYNAGTYRLYKNFTNLTDGDYNYKAYSIDVAGNVNSTETRILTIDTIKPTLVIQSPTNTNYTATNISLDYEVNDDNLDSCWYTNVTGDDVILENCANTTFIAIQGNQNITVYANDSSNNIKSTSISFFVDSIAPAQTGQFAYSLTNESVMINSTTDEAANATIKYGTDLSLSNISVNNNYTTSRIFNLAGLTNNTLYYYNLSYYDPYGNYAEYGPYNFTTYINTIEKFADLGALSNGDGSIWNPWNSLANIKNSCLEGDIININGSETITGVFYWDNGKNVTLKNWPGKTNIITIAYQDSVNDFGFNIQTGKIIINGLRFNTTGDRADSDIVIRIQTIGTIIKNSEFLDFDGTAIKVDSQNVSIQNNTIKVSDCTNKGGHGVHVNSPNATITNNRIGPICGLNDAVFVQEGGDDIIIDHNYFQADSNKSDIILRGGLNSNLERINIYNNHFNGTNVVSGIDIDASGGSYNISEVLIHNNLFANRHKGTKNNGYGVIRLNYPKSTNSDISILNNHIVNMGNDSESELFKAGIVLRGTVGNIIIKNNIVYVQDYESNNYAYAIYEDGAVTVNETDDHNIFYSAEGNHASISSYSFGPNTLNGTNPEFVNSSSDNLHLKNNSPAIERGEDLSAYFTTDYDGNNRPQLGAWDIGAYEYVGPDIYSPIISDISVHSMTNDSAIIEWNTNEEANATLNYGNTSNLGTMISNDSLSSIHSMSLSNLSANTTYYYNLTSCDTSGNCNTSGPYNFTTLNKLDNISPYWSDNNSMIVLTYSPTTQSFFNITWQDDNSSLITIYFESNYSGTPTNYSMDDQGAGVYNYSAIIPAGAHYWKSYASDSADNWNASDFWIFAIDKATPEITKSLNGIDDNLSTIYPSLVNATASTNAGTLAIYRNGTLINNGQNYSLAAGNYVFDFNVTGNENYTDATQTIYAIINKSIPSGFLYNTTPWTLTYGAAVNITISENNDGDSDVNYVIYRNGSAIGNNDTSILAAGSYEYILNATGGENYTSNASIDVKTLSVNKAVAQTSLTFNVASPQTYGTSITPTCAITSGVGSTVLTLNGTSISSGIAINLSAGTHLFNCTLAGSENYTYAENVTTFNITQSIPAITKALNGFDGNLSVIYPEQINASASTGGGSLIIYMNGSAINNGQNYSLSAGNYIFEFNVTGNENYTDNSAVLYATINKSIPSGLLYNTTPWTLSYGTDVNITISESNDGDADLTYIIYRNDTNLGNNDTSILSAGLYAYILNTSGGQNYTSNSSMDVKMLTINKAAAQTSLTFNVASPQTYGTSITPTCAIVAGVGSTVLTLNGTTITSGEPILLSAETHLFNCSLAESENYTYAENVTTFNITQSTPTITKTLNGIDSNLSVIYPSQINASASTTGGVLIIYRNGTQITNGENYSLAAGSYFFEFNVTGNENYTNNYEVLFAEINKTNSITNLLLNNNSNDLQVVYGTEINASASTNYGTITIYRNGSDATSENDLFINLSAGTYNYTAVSGGDENHTSSTITRLLNITKATPSGDLVNYSSWTITYNASFAINYSEDNNGDSDLTYTIYRNGTDIGSGDNITLAAGTYSYLLNITGGENYTSNSSADLKILTVNKASAQTSLTFDVASPQTYGASITPACSIISGVGSAILTLNGTVITSGAPIALSAGTHLFNCSLAGSENYTYAENTSVYTINQATPVITKTLNGVDSNLSVIYPAKINATASTTGGTIIIYLNGTNITKGANYSLAAGSYKFDFNVTGNENYTDAAETLYATINKSIPGGLLYNTTSWSIIYGAVVNISINENNVGDSDIIYQIHRNGTNIGNNDTSLLAAGSYGYVLNSTAGENYTSNASMDVKTLTVNKASGIVYAYVDDVRQNITIAQFDEIWLNATLNAGLGYVELYSNGTLINNGSIMIGNLTNFTVTGLYNITAKYYGNENYTSDEESWFVNVSDSTAPAWSNNITNIPINYSSIIPAYFNITWYDSNGLSAVLFETNMTGTPANHLMNHLGGGIYNYSAIFSAGSYYWKSFANDTNGLMTESSTWQFTINKATPSGNLVNYSSWTITYNASFAINYSENNDGDNDLIYIIYRNGTNLGGFDNTTLAAGAYQYILNASGGENFTTNASMDSKILTINKASAQTSLTFDVASPQTYGASITPTCAIVAGVGSTILTLNGTTISSGVVINLSAGMHMFNCSLAESENYSYAENTSAYTITQATPVITKALNGADNNLSTIYPANINATASTTGGTIIIYLNGTNITNGANYSLSAGNYKFEFNVTGNQNYSDTSETLYATINKSIPAGWLYNTTPWTLTYSAAVNITILESNNGDWDVNYLIYRNGTVIGNNDTSVLAAGSYQYLLNASGGENYTSNASMDVKILTINKAVAQTSLTFDVASPQTYGASITPTCAITSGVGSAVLALNGTIITSGTPINLSAGTHLFNCSLAGSENYTYAENVTIFNITKASPVITKYLNGVDDNLSVVYPEQINASGITSGGSLMIYRNGTSITNAANYSLSAGNYKFEFNVTGNENYTGAYAVLYAEINKSQSSMGVVVSPPSPAAYGAWTNFTCTNPQGLTTSLYINGTDKTAESGQNISRAAGAYNVTCYSAGNENYTQAYDETSFIINKATPTGALYNTTSWSLTYGAAVNITVSENNIGDADVNYYIYRNNTLIGNNDTSILSAGSYQYLLNASGGENYTSNTSMDSKTLIINKASSSINLTLNNNNDDLTIDEGSSVLFNISMTPLDGFAYLYENNTLLYNATTRFNFTKTYVAAGIYLITANWSGNENYSASQMNYTITVQDNTPPAFTDISNLTGQDNESLYYDINATDISGVSCFGLNDTNFFSINCAGILSNNSPLSASTYSLNITVNDTYNNMNSIIITINITNSTLPDLTAPIISAVLNHSITNDSAIINWTTDENSNSTILYGISPSSLTDQTDDLTQSTSHSITLTDLQNNTIYYYNITSCDLAGNCAQDGTYEFTTEQNTDSTPPTITSVLNYSITNQSAIINWTTDETSNSTILYGTSPSSLTSEESNIANEQNHSFMLSNLINDTNYYYNITSCDMNANCVMQGPYVFRTASNIIDLIYPTIEYSPDTPANASYSSQDLIYINVTAYDENENSITFYLYNETGLVASTTLSAGQRNTTFTNLPDATYQYNVTITDISGNTNSTETRQIILDTQIPLITFGEGTSENNISQNQDYIFINITLTENNFKNVTFHLYNSTEEINTTTYEDSTREINYASLAEGIYYYNITAYDLADNAGESETRIITLDSTPPTINLTYPNNDSSSTDPTPLVIINLTDNLDQTINYSVFINDTATGQTGAGNVFTENSISLNQVPLGSHYLVIEASDRAGNMINSTRLYFTVLPPAVYLSSPANNHYSNTNNITFTFNVSDPLNSELNCSLYINGTYIQSNSTTNNYTQTQFYLSEMNEGNNQEWMIICINPQDNQGNDTSTFSIDLTNPAIDYSAGTSPDNEFKNSNSIFINITAYDLNEANITFKLYDSSNSTINQTTKNLGNRYINFTDLSPGEYYYDAIMHDLSGRNGTAQKRKITLDTLTPTINLMAPLNNTLITTQTVTFSYNITDDHAMKNCSIYINGIIENTITNPQINATLTYQKTMTNANHNWSVECFDMAGNRATTTKRNFSVQYEAPQDDDPPAGGGGGGGGGGGASMGGGAGGTIYLVTRPELITGFTQVANKGDMFKINNTIGYDYLTLKNIVGQTALFNASFENKLLLILLGEEFELSNNVTILMTQTTEKNATIKLYPTAEEEKEEKIPTISNITINETTAQAQSENHTKDQIQPLNQTTETKNIADDPQTTIKPWFTPKIGQLLKIIFIIMIGISIMGYSTIYFIKRKTTPHESSPDLESINKELEKLNKEIGKEFKEFDNPVTTHNTPAQQPQTTITPEIINLRKFITQQRQKGITDHEIKNKLLSVGWKHEIIDEELKKQ